ncbi:hypothetical protein ElyMa_005172600 [Elysia marginata]|uniref:Uncharacterized protein n=1 Tax=Elysia marginata TaxID=1093978 RepID=A0AAV4JSG6_9GAST|nr:hypothetical protein ElyMa_005172600 [Elysia marginata]
MFPKFMAFHADKVWHPANSVVCESIARQSRPGPERSSLWKIWFYCPDHSDFIVGSSRATICKSVPWSSLRCKLGSRMPLQIRQDSNLESTFHIDYSIRCGTKPYSYLPLVGKQGGRMPFAHA